MIYLPHCTSFLRKCLPYEILCSVEEHAWTLAFEHARDILAPSFAGAKLTKAIFAVGACMVRFPLSGFHKIHLSSMLWLLSNSHLLKNHADTRLERLEGGFACTAMLAGLSFIGTMSATKARLTRARLRYYWLSRQLWHQTSRYVGPGLNTITSANRYHICMLTR